MSDPRVSHFGFVNASAEEAAMDASSKLRGSTSTTRNLGSGSEVDRYASHFSLGADGLARVRKLAEMKGVGAEQDRYGNHFSGADVADKIKEKVSGAFSGVSGAEQDRYRAHFSLDGEAVRRATGGFGFLRGTSGAEQDRHAGHFSFDGAERKVRSELDSAGSKIRSEFDSAGSKIRSGLDEAGDKLRSGVNQAEQKIRSGADTVDQKLRSGYSEADQKLRSGYSQAEQKVRSGYSQAEDKLRSGYSQAGDALRSSANEAESKFKSVSSGFRSTSGAEQDRLANHFSLDARSFRQSVSGLFNTTTARSSIWSDHRGVLDTLWLGHDGKQRLLKLPNVQGVGAEQDRYAGHFGVDRDAIQRAKDKVANAFQ